MKDYKKPNNRQQYLATSIRKNLLVRKLSALKKQAERDSLNGEASLLEKVIEYLEGGQEGDYLDLLKTFKLQQLRA